jgi:hypothetical protein
LKAQAKSTRETVAAKPLAGLETAWDKGSFTGDRWIELICSGV